jgi:hypothetical protein
MEGVRDNPNWRPIAKKKTGLSRPKGRLEPASILNRGSECRGRSAATPGSRSAGVVAFAAADPFACLVEPPHSGAQEGKNYETIHQVHLFSLLSGCWDTVESGHRSDMTDSLARGARRQPPQTRQASRNGQLPQFRAEGAG